MNVSKIQPNIPKQALNVTKLIGSDSVFRKNNQAAMSAYMEFLSVRLNHPTRANVALQHYIKVPPLGCHSETITKNLKSLEQIPHLNFLKKMGDDNTKKIYPKTYLLRDELINQSRIELNQTIPKMSFLEKLKYKKFFK